MIIINIFKMATTNFSGPVSSENGFAVNGVASAAFPLAVANYTTSGGAAAEAITVTGALATDVPFVTLQDDGTGNVNIASVALTADTLTVTFSTDPGSDAVISYAIFRPVS